MAAGHGQNGTLRFDKRRYILSLSLARSLLTKDAL
jgi:hypothetical protein